MFCLHKETAGEEEETSSNHVLCTSCGKYRDCADYYLGAKRLSYNSGSMTIIMVGIKCTVKLQEFVARKNREILGNLGDDLLRFLGMKVV